MNTTTTSKHDGTTSTIVTPQDNDVILLGVTLKEKEHHPGTRFYWQRVEHFFYNEICHEEKIMDIDDGNDNHGPANATISAAPSLSSSSSLLSFSSSSSSSSDDPISCARRSERAKKIMQAVTTQTPPGRFLVEHTEKDEGNDDNPYWKVMGNKSRILAKIIFDLKHYQETQRKDLDTSFESNNVSSQLESKDTGVTNNRSVMKTIGNGPGNVGFSPPSVVFLSNNGLTPTSNLDCSEKNQVTQQSHDERSEAKLSSSPSCSSLPSKPKRYNNLKHPPLTNNNQDGDDKEDDEANIEYNGSRLLTPDTKSADQEKEMETYSESDKSNLLTSSDVKERDTEEDSSIHSIPSNIQLESPSSKFRQNPSCHSKRGSVSNYLQLEENDVYIVKKGGNEEENNRNTAGSQLFRDLIAKYREEYRRSPDLLIVTDIVDSIRKENGRFLGRNEETNKMEILSGDEIIAGIDSVLLSNTSDQLDVDAATATNQSGDKDPIGIDSSTSESHRVSFVARSIKRSTGSSTSNKKGICIVPRTHDVLCGKGISKRTRSQPGNHHYNKVIDKYMEKFRQFRDRDSRDNIISQIIETFHNLDPPGRFLVWNPSRREWGELETNFIEERIRKRFYIYTIKVYDNDIVFDQNSCILDDYDEEYTSGNAWLMDKVEEYTNEKYNDRKETSIANEIMRAMETEVYPPIRFLRASKGDKLAVMSDNETAKVIIELLNSSSSSNKANHYDTRRAKTVHGCDIDDDDESVRSESDSKASSMKSSNPSIDDSSVNSATPPKHDVICDSKHSRGLMMNHPGNKNYYQLINKSFKEYEEHPNDSIVDHIIESLNNLEPPARFIDLDRPDGEWYEISEKRVRDKIRMALKTASKNDNRRKGRTQVGAFISSPQKNDVICGAHWNSLKNHPGNQHYIDLIGQHADQYHRSNKDSIIDEIINTFENLEPRGRFLAQDTLTGKYIELSEEKVRNKIQMALSNKQRYRSKLGPRSPSGNDVKFGKNLNVLDSDAETHAGFKWLRSNIEKYSDEAHRNRKENSIVHEIMNAMKTKMKPPVRFMKATIGNKWGVMSEDETRSVIEKLLRSSHRKRKHDGYASDDNYDNEDSDANLDADSTKSEDEYHLDSDDNSKGFTKKNMEYAQHPKRRCRVQSDTSISHSGGTRNQQAHAAASSSSSRSSNRRATIPRGQQRRSHSCSREHQSIGNDFTPNNVPQNDVSNESNVIRHSSENMEMNCIRTLRNLSKRGMLRNETVTAMHYDILTTKFNNSGGIGSRTLIGHEMLFGALDDNDDTKIAEEQFAALCERIEPEL